MATFIAVEGIDGAGKRTLVEGLRRQWETGGVRVATVAFPRYGESIHADLTAEALRGGHGDLSQSAYAMALLFALDRRDCARRLRELIDDYEQTLANPYVAAERGFVDAVIEPAETRLIICTALQSLVDKREQLAHRPHDNSPL